MSPTVSLVISRMSQTSRIWAMGIRYVCWVVPAMIAPTARPPAAVTTSDPESPGEEKVVELSTVMMSVNNVSTPLGPGTSIEPATELTIPALGAAPEPHFRTSRSAAAASDVGGVMK